MSTPPVLVVLCASQDDAPPQLAALADRVDLRIATEADLGEALRGARALFLWDFFSSAVRDVWPRCGDLEWIHVAAAGVDTLLFDELRASEVVVTNARGVFDRPIAEYVLAAVLAHAKRLHESAELQRRHEWRHRETRPLRGARAVVVGTGGIGRETAHLLTTAGLDVSVAGSSARTDPELGEVVDSGRLAEHLAGVDYLVNAAPLTDRTRGLIDAEVLTALPPTAHLVNVGRGPTVVEEDLLAALQEGRLDGATLDVFATEPLPPDSPLWDAPGVVVSPHMSGDVVGWRDTLADQFVANARRWLDEEPLENVVDKERGYVPGGGTGPQPG
ncbi:D-2-hydroxyacid dehydrogenase [Ornithinimicrobium kibberense]|uniref:D-2-hydroxyacid dehydrogenase n=1 Tax=Ornithinimicrobium kibberense TaxID=282060 RepID=A0ABV5V507_9MICO|nr:D-2-hydroxyacid dehydrogenase [Ornithinimicrobium kibberense]